MPGSRHHTLLRAAGKLGRLVGGGALDEKTAFAELRAAAEHHIGIDRFTSREADKTISDGLAWGCQHPRYLTS